MFCKNCGTQIEDSAVFCPECGTKVAAVPAQVVPAQPAQNTTGLLILSIVGLVLFESGLPGLIVSIIARKKVKEYVRNGGELTGKANIANTLSLIGVILGIVMTVLAILGAVFTFVFRTVFAEFFREFARELLGELSSEFNIFT